MKLSLIETVRKLIRQSTEHIGRPVGNWHGVSVRENPIEVLAGTHSWAVLTVASRGFLELQQFFSRVSRVSGTAALAFSDSDGSTTVTAVPGTVVALRAVVRTQSRISTTVNVSVEGAGQCAVYVNGVLARRGSGTLAVPLVFDSGDYTVVVLAQATSVTVAASPNLKFMGEVEVPPIPTWQSLTTGYLDPAQGTVANTLTWINNPAAGGYRVLRRTPSVWAPTSLTTASPLANGWGEVVSVGGLLGDGTAIVTIATGQVDLDATIEAIVDALEGDLVEGINGTSLYLSSSRIGTAQSASYSLREVDGTTSELLVNIQFILDPALNETDQNWLEEVVTTGDYIEIYRENQLSAGTFGRYVDNAVERDVYYEYVLQARGLVDETTWGPLSTVEFVTAGDSTAPGPIADLDVTVLNRTATARFTTPDDPDYAGTKIVYRIEALADDDPRTFYEVTDVTGNVVTVTPAIMPTAGAGLTGFQLKFGDPDVASSQFFFTVTSNTAGTLTLDNEPDPDTVFTGEDVYLYQDQEVALVPGLPGEEEQAAFSPQGYGDYLFLPFDRSGNVADEDRTNGIWVYDPTDDRFSTEPIVAVRQLTTTEQQYFTDDAVTDPALYAIFELFSYSPEFGATNATTLYYLLKGTADEVSLEINPTNLQPYEAGAFPQIVTSSVGTAVDDPLGTRSRYVALSRIDGENWIRVRAEDLNGRVSGVMTFFVDYDETPEITALETSISNSSDTATFTAVVDDDTQAVSWWVVPAAAGEPTAASKATVDTRSLRSFSATVALALGTRKQLYLTPYPIYNGSVASGTAGATVTRDLVRTPRSFVNLDNKDEFGRRSAEKVTAKFSVVPEPAEVAASNTMTGFTAPNIITDTGEAWTVNQWATSNTKHYFVEVQPPDQNGVPVDPYTRKILSNTANTISFYGSPPATYVMTNATYRVLDGGVEVRTRATGTVPPALRANYFGTTGIEVYDRTSDFLLEFFGTKTGCLAENERLMLVDADTRASITGLAYVYDDGEATLGFTSADDDAKTWRAYERKDAWPTLDGTETGTLDDQYLRFSGSIDQQSYTHTALGATATWYAIAVPTNGLNEDGDRATATLVLTAPPAGLVSAHTVQEVATDEVTIYYLHTAGAPGTVTITAWRSDLGPSSVTTLVSGRAVATDAVGAATDRGSYTHDTGEVINYTSGTPRQWNYTVTYSGGGSVTATWKGYTQGPGGYSGSLTAAAANVVNQGECSFGACIEAHIRRITWTVTDIPDNDYRIEIDVSDDVGGPWTPYFTNILPSWLSQDDYTECLYYDAGGTLTTWAYRIRVVGLHDGLTKETDIVSVAETVLTCGGGMEA